MDSDVSPLLAWIGVTNVQWLYFACVDYWSGNYCRYGLEGCYLMSLEELDRNYKWHHAEFFGLTPKADSALATSEGMHGLFGYEYPYSGDKASRQATESLETALEARAISAIATTPELLREAKGWVSDCIPESEPIEAWHTLSVLDYIKRHYSGGAIGFYMSNRVLAPIRAHGKPRPELEFFQKTTWHYLGCKWVHECYEGSNADLRAFNDPRETFEFIKHEHIGDIAGFMAANRAEFNRLEELKNA
jgi:hypothetical protein